MVIPEHYIEVDFPMNQIDWCFTACRYKSGIYLNKRA